MGMDSVFRVSLVLDMVDNMTSKVQGAADGVPSAVQKMNDAFGTMQKAGVAMTGMGTAIVGACMGTLESKTLEPWNRLQRTSQTHGREPRSRISYPPLMISSPVLRL